MVKDDTYNIFHLFWWQMLQGRYMLIAPHSGSSEPWRKSSNIWFINDTLLVFTKYQRWDANHHWYKAVYSKKTKHKFQWALHCTLKNTVKILYLLQIYLISDKVNHFMLTIYSMIFPMRRMLYQRNFECHDIWTTCNVYVCRTTFLISGSHPHWGRGRLSSS